VLRELNTIADQALYTEMRTGLEKELEQVIEHMCQFVNGLGSEKGQVGPNMWSRKGPVTSYAFLLVARPDNNGTKGYVTKAIEQKNDGANRLYLLAKEEQKFFAKQVVKEIVNTGEYRLEDFFDLHKDYRCNEGGYGAVLVVTE